jgi:3-isopropylmalate/(R)-2-methylmalate dehydratase large subunit
MTAAPAPASAAAAAARSPATVAEKILSRVVGRAVRAGEIVFPEPELVTVHDWYVANFAKALDELGVTRLHDASRVLFSTDHEPIALSPAAADRQRAIRAIAARYGVTRFFDAGRGGHGHVFPVEQAIVRPGQFVEGYDTHVTNYGAVGALAFAVLVEVAELLACGSIWCEVPASVRVNLFGRLSPGVYPRDAAQALIGGIDPEIVDDTVVEFGGPALAHLDIDARFTLVNTPAEIGARSALVEPDAIVSAYYAARGVTAVDLVHADAGAAYRAVFDRDLSTIEPQVACPPRPDNVAPVRAVAGRAIDHAYIGSCASGTLSDMRVAAAILRGRKLAPRVRFFVTPATQSIAAAMAAEGLTQAFVEAGALVTAPGCGVCAGGKIGPVSPGEISISTGTRNDPGRLGPQDADLYLASPATVAASAVAGVITDPREFAR